MNKIIESILSRESCREFSKKNINKKTIRILFNCGRKAPRSQGNEFIEFYFIQSKEILEQIFWILLTLRKAYACSVTTTELLRSMIEDPFDRASAF